MSVHQFAPALLTRSNPHLLHGLSTHSAFRCRRWYKNLQFFYNVATCVVCISHFMKIVREIWRKCYVKPKLHFLASLCVSERWYSYVPAFGLIFLQKMFFSGDEYYISKSLQEC